MTSSPGEGRRTASTPTERTAPIGWPARGATGDAAERAAVRPPVDQRTQRLDVQPEARPSRPTRGGTTGVRAPRRAQLTLRRIDPWSVFKFMLLFSVCMLIVFLVAVTMLYAVLDSMGVFSSVNEAINDLIDTNEDGSTIDNIFSARRIIGGAAVIGSINALLITALATLGAFIYNLCADLAGGIDVTLGERE